MTEVKWSNQRNLSFLRFQRGPTFSRGVQLLLPYRNPYNLRFSRGGSSFFKVPEGSNFFQGGPIASSL